MKRQFSRASSKQKPNRRQADLQKARDEERQGQSAFRRNRTLTGSTSGSISSSSELSANIKSPRAHVHHLSRHRRRISMLLAAVLLLCVGMYIFLINFAGTTAIVVTDYGTLNEKQSSQYHDALDSFLRSQPFERFTLLLDESKFSSHMQGSINSVEHADLEPTGKFGEAQLVVTARKPLARWSGGQGVEFVDKDGVIFSTNYYKAPKLRIVDNSGITSTNAKVVTSRRTLQFAGRIIAALQSYDLAVDDVEIPIFTTREIDIKLKSDKTLYKLNIDRPVGRQAEDLMRAHRYFEQKNLSPEYADIRVGSKAYYR